MGFLDRITGNEEVWMVQHGCVSRSTLGIAKSVFASVYLTEKEAYEGAASDCDRAADRYETDAARMREEAREHRRRAAACEIAARKK